MSDIVVTPRLTIPAGELSIAFARSGGPGGQNVNKVASKVDLRWNPLTSAAVRAALRDDEREYMLANLANRLTNDGDLIVTSTLTRDQIKNRSDAESKLALIIRTALHRDKPRRATKPSRAAKRRRVEGKRHRAQIKANRRGGD